MIGYGEALNDVTEKYISENPVLASMVKQDQSIKCALLYSPKTY
jgi:hypothetical protein